MDYHSAKHKELSEQLGAWWSGQTEFKTKRELAGLLKVHPDTLGDYFSGKKFPKADIACRLSEFTGVACLKAEAGSGPITAVLPPPLASVAVTVTEVPGVPQKGQRQGEKAVIVSLQRTSCPFCEHDIAQFTSCQNCGQQFVWAGVPVAK